MKAFGASVDIDPVPDMLFLRQEVHPPGTFGRIGVKVGEYGINISQVTVGATGIDNTEVMGLALDRPITAEQTDDIMTAVGLEGLRRVVL